MKIFTNSKVLKKIAIFLIIITLCSFVMPKSAVRAETFTEDANEVPGGKMLNPIVHLLMYIGDAILNMLQNNFLSTTDIIVEAQSDQYQEFNGWALLGVVLSVIGFVVGICLAVPTAGASLAGSVKCFAIGAAVCTTSAFAFQLAGSEFLDDWDGNFDIPLIQYTPYAIFSGQIPALDINFIDPMEPIERSRIVKEWKSINTALASILDSKKNDEETASSLVNIFPFNEANQISQEEFNENQPNENFKISTTKNKTTYTFYIWEEGDNYYCLTTSIYSDNYGTVTNYYKYSSNIEANPMQTRVESILKGDKKDNDFSWLQNNLEWKETTQDDYNNILNNMGSNKIEYHTTGANSNSNSDIYLDKKNKTVTAIYMKRLVVGTYVDETTYKKATFEIKDYEDVEEETSKEKLEQTYETTYYESSGSILQSSISTWYRVLRTVALVGLLSVLVYVGIRILFTSVAADKAKYKKMLVDWIVAVCMLFILHYIMAFILTISTSLTKVVIPKATNNLVFLLPEDTKIGDGDGTELAAYAESQMGEYEKKGYTIEENLILKKDEKGVERPTWIGDYVGYIRLIAGVKTTSIATVYGIMYLVLVIYTCMFTFMYLKRVLYMAFLTMIAPLIALTYPLDKIKDGKAQAFSLWLREYIFNALIQPVHLILYTMLMSNVLNLAVEHPVYALVALGFFTPAERFIRKMFGFESAGTVSALGQMAGGAAVMGAVNKLSKLNKRKKKDEEEDKDKIRTKEEGGYGLPFAPSGQGDNDHGENGPIPAPRQNNENSSEQFGANNSNSTPYDSRLTPEQREELEAEGIEPGDPEYDHFLSNYGIRGRDPQGNSEQNLQHNPAEQSQEGDSNSEGASKPRMRSKIYAGMNKVGNHYRKKLIKAKPLRTIGKWSGRIIGGATLGTVGLAAGIASGDASKAFSYTAAGAGVGGALGGTVAENVMDEGHEFKENFKKGYQGEAEYTNKKLDEEYYNGTGKGENFQDLLEQDDLKGDLKGRERANAMREEVQAYRKSGITDNGQISTCMRAGLTPEEGVYAVQISKAMEKSGWNNSKIQKEYEANCRKLLRDNNITEERINEIWNAVPKLLF